jgi:hypothetical protein
MCGANDPAISAGQNVAFICRYIKKIIVIEGLLNTISRNLTKPNNTWPSLIKSNEQHSSALPTMPPLLALNFVTESLS